MVGKGNFLFWRPIFRCYVSFRECTWTILITLASKLKISGAMYSGEPHTVAASPSVRYINGRVMCGFSTLHGTVPQNYLKLGVFVESSGCWYDFLILQHQPRFILTIHCLHNTCSFKLVGKMGIRAMSCSGKALAKPKSASFNTGSTEPRLFRTESHLGNQK